jgi:2,3-bisphosphoglycerate-independent phosphoglycerate mutase
VVYQDLTRIDQAIENKSFFKNAVLNRLIQETVDKDKAIHIFGLLSKGGVHSLEAHIHAVLQLIATYPVKKVYLHAFLDGRDTPPSSAKPSLQAFNDKITSIIGRYYAMDRDKRYERTQQAYDLITEGRALFHADDAVQALEMAYARGETDEFVQATLVDPNYPGVKDDDAIIFMNFRADRARQLTRAFIDPDFTGFTRTVWPKVRMVTLSEYDETFHLPVVFPKQSLHNILGQYLSERGLTQLRIAETEKYAHVTFFFNGGIEKPFPLEDRILIPSPKVATYDLKPEMSALELTERLVAEIKNKKYDVIICNFANPDMLGHTGNFAATVQAIEVIDACLAKIIPALQAVGGEALITADHGNAEMMFDDKTGQAHTAHTHELVPLLYVGRKARFIKSNGVLSDISPTMLYLLGLPTPPEMTGESLLEFA